KRRKCEPLFRRARFRNAYPLLRSVQRLLGLTSLEQQLDSPRRILLDRRALPAVRATPGLGQGKAPGRFRHPPGAAGQSRRQPASLERGENPGKRPPRKKAGEARSADRSIEGGEQLENFLRGSRGLRTSCKSGLGQVPRQWKRRVAGRIRDECAPLA